MNARLTFEITCSHQEHWCSASIPRFSTGNDTEVTEMINLCIDCFSHEKEAAQKLSLPPLTTQFHCIDCGHSPVRYLSTIAIAICDRCRTLSDDSSLTLPFLRNRIRLYPKKPQNVYNNQVYLGCRDCACNREGLRELGISAVLVCGTGLPLFFQEEGTIRYHLLPIEDSLEQNLFLYLPSAMAFIDQVVDEGGRVLVHCYAGISRSAAVVIAWLMQRFQWNYDKAFLHVLSCRRKICPNNHFAKTLRELWSAQLVAQETSGSIQTA
eukprot:gene2911-3178_t